MIDTDTEKPKNFKPKIYKSMLLIHAYMQGVPIENPSILADQEYILRLAPRILSYMVELSMEYTMYCKLIGIRAIKFSQLFFQGLEQGDSNFLQLPYMSREVFKKWQRRSKLAKTSFKEYIALPKEHLGCADFFDPVQTKEIESAVDSFPRITLDAKCYVKGSDKIFQGDLLTIEVNVTRKYGTQENVNTEVPNGIHSNRYPFPKQEILWLVVASREHRRVFDFAKLHRPFSTMRKEYSVFLDKVLSKIIMTRCRQEDKSSRFT